jgi:hypothetical protein
MNFFVFTQYTSLHPNFDPYFSEVHSKATSLYLNISNKLSSPSLAHNDNLLDELYTVEAYYLDVGLFLLKRLNFSVSCTSKKLLVFYLILLAFDSIITQYLSHLRPNVESLVQARPRNPYLYSMH